MLCLTCSAEWQQGMYQSIMENQFYDSEIQREHYRTVFCLTCLAEWKKGISRPLMENYLYASKIQDYADPALCVHDLRHGELRDPATHYSPELSGA